MTSRRFTGNTRPMDFHKLHRDIPWWQRKAVLGGAILGAALGAVSAFVWAMV